MDNNVYLVEHCTRKDAPIRSPPGIRAGLGEHLSPIERSNKIPIGDQGEFEAWFANRVRGWRVAAPLQTRPIAIPSRVCVIQLPCWGGTIGERRTKTFEDYSFLTNTPYPGKEIRRISAKSSQENAYSEFSIPQYKVNNLALSVRHPTYHETPPDQFRAVGLTSYKFVLQHLLLMFGIFLVTQTLANTWISSLPHAQNIDADRGVRRRHTTDRTTVLKLIKKLSSSQGSWRKQGNGVVFAIYDSRGSLAKGRAEIGGYGV
ncbi:hypothetical protein Tco_0314110 [Tanacetum coccineum]